MIEDGLTSDAKVPRKISLYFSSAKTYFEKIKNTDSGSTLKVLSNCVFIKPYHDLHLNNE
jgi:hypothetical protein